MRGLSVAKWRSMVRFTPRAERSALLLSADSGGKHPRRGHHGLDGAVVGDTVVLDGAI